MLEAFDPYVRELEELARTRYPEKGLDFSRHLDGEAGRQLRNVVSIDELRRVGAFFTGEVHAAELLRLVPDSVDHFTDPACGCGDLLLSASSRLPVMSSLEATLRLWNKRLSGRDLVPEFVRAARARLVLAAISRGAYPTEGNLQPAALLDSIAVGDGLELPFVASTAVLLNPPYGLVSAPADCAWSAGRTTAAAVFLDGVLKACPGGVHIAAVLPEVLRAGSRYSRFRNAVENRLLVSDAKPAGVFDALTDVDVFLLAGETRKPGSKVNAFQWFPPPPSERLEDVGEVRVGAVVANRDPHLGPWKLYVDAREIGGASIFHPRRHRRFRGTVVEPPFVAIGRTNRSNGGDSPRLRGTIVIADRAVAVENHLITVVPNQHTVAGCREIVKIIESQDATEFLEERLRCRHLTVQALRELPR